MFNAKIDSKLRIKIYTSLKTYNFLRSMGHLYSKERVVQIRGTSNYYEQTDSFVHVLCVFIVISISLELADAIMCVS